MGIEQLLRVPANRAVLVSFKIHRKGIKTSKLSVLSDTNQPGMFIASLCEASLCEVEVSKYFVFELC